MEPRKEVLADGCEIWLGDCRQVIPMLDNVNAVICDPPYGNSNHDGDFNARLNEHRGIENKPIANDDAGSMKEVLDAALSLCLPLMPKKVSACCCFCGGGGADSGLCMACGSDGFEGPSVLSFGHLGQAQSGAWPSIPKAA